MSVADAARFTSGPLRLRARWVVPVSLPPIANGEVVVEDGRIVHIGPAPKGGVSDAVECGDMALMPGFVNVHAHLEYTVLRGLLEDIGFFPWIRTLTALKAYLSADDWVASATLGAAEMLQAGVTTLADASDAGAALPALLSSGMRGIVYREVFGIEATPDTPTIVSQLKSKVAVMRAQVARAGGDDRVQIGISPHAPYTVRPDLLTALQEWAMREGLPSTIHVAESGGEVELISSGKGPFGEMFARRGIQWSVPGGSPVAYLDTCQALGPNVLAVHCVHVSEADIATLKARSVSVAHCPKSNGKLGAGIAPVAAMRRAGVRVGIGTDSMVSNNGADMFEEMRMVLYFARAHAQSPDALTAKDALHMATLGGAEALELDKQVGSLTGGKLADICAVRLDGLNAFPTGEDNPQAALVYGARASDVAWTMVNGRVLYESGRHTLVDVPRLKNALRPLRAHLHQQTEKLLGKAY